MRSFIYGRYDVLQGARGYETFDRHRDISREAVKELATVFSSQDPDFRILQVLGTFYVYFPLSGGDWVFGKGEVEERGDFFSYILHGLLLDERERKALDYNPFPLAQLLNPLVGDRRELPPLAGPFPGDQKEGEERLVAALDACGQAENGNLLYYIAGELATKLVSPGAAPGGLYHPYRKNMDPSLWTLVFQLLPPRIRQRVTLATLGRFLQRETLVRGEFDPGDTPVNRQIFPDRPERSDFGQFLFNLSRKNHRQKREGFLILAAANADADSLQAQGLAVELDDDPAHWLLEYLGNTLRALDKPSVHSLGRWSVVQSYTDLFAWKASYLAAIWERNRFEPAERFPRLAEDILATLQRDFRIIDAHAGPEATARARPHLDRVVELLGATSDRRLLAGLLADKDLARDFLPRIADRDLVGALFEPDLPEAVFHRSLRHRLEFVGNWSRDLSLLFEHPHFHTLGPATHAAVFDLIPPKEPAAWFMDRLTSYRFQDHPDEFKVFLTHLRERRRILSRFINFFRKRIRESLHEPRACDYYWQLLWICAEVDEPVFRQAVVPWIKYPEIEEAVVTLMRHPDLFDLLASAWQEVELDVPARLRLCFLIKHKCRASGEDYRRHPYVAAFLADHKFSGLLLEFR